MKLPSRLNRDGLQTEVALQELYADATEPERCVDLRAAGIKRYEDMSPDGFLRILQEPDGDLIVYIAGERFGRPTAAAAQFCTVGGGGGRSPHTRQALIDLATAMTRDNRENPQSRD